MKFVEVQVVPRDGLGLPIVPIVIGAASAIGGLFAKKKKPKVTREDAKRAVQQIYLELLERDPWNPYDPGAEGFVTCLVDGWCDVDFVRTGVLTSQERKDVELRRVARTYGASAGGGAPVSAGGVPSSGAPSYGTMPAIPSSIGGIPLPYLIGGLVLLMLLKR